MRTAPLAVLLGICFCVASWAGPASAQAQEIIPPAIVVADPLDDVHVTTRIDQIQGALDAGTVRASLWYWGFAGVQLGSGTVNGILAFTPGSQPGFLVNRVVGAVQGYLGFLSLLINPMVASRAAAKLRALPSDSPTERRSKLAAAESLLERSADRERAGRAWYTHVIGITAGAASGLLLAFAFKETSWVDGLINFGIVVAFAELQIWTMPTKAIKDWELYQQTGELPVARRRVVPSFGIAAAPGGVAASVVF